MKIVTHFIAGYPDYPTSLEAAKGLMDGGAFALEMQIPFSDPSADGPVIEAACRKSLEAGFKVKNAFDLLKDIKKYSDIPVYIMSYSGIVFNMGIPEFIRQAKESSCSGLIIPDLTPGNDEGLYEEGRRNALSIVPVVVPGVSDSRLREIMKEQPEWVYLALRSGITGSYTRLDAANLGFIKKLKSCRVKIMAGFGISTPEQVEILMSHCEAAIAGSYIVKGITGAIENNQSVRQAAAECVRFLIGKALKAETADYSG